MAWIFYACALTLLCAKTNGEIFNLTINEEQNLLSFPGDIVCNGATEIEWFINVNISGYGVALIFNQTNIDPDNEEHFFFAVDKDSDGSDSSVAYVTGQQNNLKLALPLVQEAYLRFSARDACNENSTFNVTLRQLDPKAPDPPATTPSPYPPAGLKTDILVYLAGKTLGQFQVDSFQDKLRQFLQIEAFNFTAENDIVYNPNKLANETVFLRNPHQCSEKWPDYETCVAVWLSIYVTEPRKPYELSIDHLQTLWDKIIAKQFPEEFGIQSYVYPDITIAILWWVLWIFIALVITSAIGWGIWRVQSRAKDDEQTVIFEKEDNFMFDPREKHAGVTFRDKKTHQLPLNKHPLPKYMVNPDEQETSFTTKPIEIKFTRPSDSQNTKYPGAIYNTPLGQHINHGYLSDDDEEV